MLVRNTDNTMDSRTMSQHIKTDLYELYRNRPCLLQNTKLPSLVQVFLSVAAHFQVECQQRYLLLPTTKQIRLNLFEILTRHSFVLQSCRGNNTIIVNGIPLKAQKKKTEKQTRSQHLCLRNKQYKRYPSYMNCL